MRFAVVIEKATMNYSAYVLDHIEGLRADGLPVPEPSSRVEYVEVPA